MSDFLPYARLRSVPQVACVVYRNLYQRNPRGFLAALRTISPHAPLVTVGGLPFPLQLVEAAVARGEIAKVGATGSIAKRVKGASHGVIGRNPSAREVGRGTAKAAKATARGAKVAYGHAKRGAQAAAHGLSEFWGGLREANPDEEMRALERAAKLGDRQAQARLRQMQARVGRLPAAQKLRSVQASSRSRIATLKAEIADAKRVKRDADRVVSGLGPPSSDRAMARKVYFEMDRVIPALEAELAAAQRGAAWEFSYEGPSSRGPSGMWLRANPGCRYMNPDGTVTAAPASPASVPVPASTPSAKANPADAFVIWRLASPYGPQAPVDGAQTMAQARAKLAQAREQARSAGYGRGLKFEIRSQSKANPHRKYHRGPKPPQGGRGFDPHTVASEWHGGQFSPLYAFSSTGHVDERTEGEVEHAIRSLGRTPKKERKGQYRRLKMLKEHVAGVKPKRNPLDSHKPDCQCLFHRAGGMRGNR